MSAQTRIWSRAIARSKPSGIRTTSHGMAPDNHYDTLQIKIYADPATIRQAYRRLAREAHPDVNRTSDATQRMQVVNEAYGVLRDPARRAPYDVERFARALQDALPEGPALTPTDRHYGRGFGRRTLGAVRAMIGKGSLE